MKLPLCYLGNPILRKKCAQVLAIDDTIKQLVQDMEETVIALRGLGLAAPQIGKSIALFILRIADDGHDDGDDTDHDTITTEVFINPKITSHSKETWMRGEACLSIPKFYAEVERPTHITVEATDLEGNRFTKHYSMGKARAVLHENDHLNGTLFIDRIRGKERQKLERSLKLIEKQYRLLN